MLYRSRSWLIWCRNIGDAVERFGSDLRFSLNFIGVLFDSLWAAIRHPRFVKWQTVAYYVDTCGAGALPIISLLGLLIGVILAFQGLVQLSRYGGNSYVVNLVGAVIVTELAPLMTAVVLAGRSGSAFAAEIGTMQTGEEVDALITMGLEPERFLLTPKVLALLVVLPSLDLVASVCGIIGGMLVICARVEISMTEYFYKVIDVVQVIDLCQGLIKSVVFGLIIASVGCMRGFAAPRDAQGVGRAATAAIVTAIFLIIVADAIITAIFSL